MTSPLILATVRIVHLTIYHVMICLNRSPRYSNELSLKPNIHNVHVYIYSVFILSTILCTLRHLVNGPLRAQRQLIWKLVVVLLHLGLVPRSSLHLWWFHLLFRSPSVIVVSRYILYVTVVFPTSVCLRQIILAMNHAGWQHRIQIFLVYSAMVG